MLIAETLDLGGQPVALVLGLHEKLVAAPFGDDVTQSGKMRAEHPDLAEQPARVAAGGPG